MRKILTAGMAALTLAGSLAATATPAAAQSHGSWHGGNHSSGSWHGGGGSWHGGGGNWHGGNGWHGGGYRGSYYRGGDGVGAAIAGGVVGLALGAALSDHGGYYNRGYSNGGYYDGGYGYYDEGYAVCTGDRRIWDPYIGRYVIRRYEYAC